MELIFADDLVLVAKTKELLLEQLDKWRSSMEIKDLRVNAGKTKVMRCQVSKGQVEVSGRDLCSVCRKGVGGNSILCMECHSWVHKKCTSGISGKLKNNIDFDCKRCFEDSPDQSVLLRDRTKC